MMRVYIAGPMTGIAYFNRAAFDIEATRQAALGREPVNPIDTDPRHDGRCPVGMPIDKQDASGGEHPHPCWVRASLRDMLTCRRIIMLPGWAKSPGAVLEHSVAWAAGLTVEYREDS